MRTPVPDDEELVGRFRLAVTRLARVVRQEDHDLMGPTDVAILSAIAWEHEPTLSRLATTEHVAPPTVTKSINHLEAIGLVERFDDPDDGRVTRARLSAKGRRQIAAYRKRVNAQLEDLLSDVSAKDRQRLQGTVELLEHLVINARAKQDE